MRYLAFPHLRWQPWHVQPTRPAPPSLSRPKPFPAIHIIAQHPPRTQRPATTPSPSRKFPSPHRRAPAPELRRRDRVSSSVPHAATDELGSSLAVHHPRPPAPSSGKPNLAFSTSHHSRSQQIIESAALPATPPSASRPRRCYVPDPRMKYVPEACVSFEMDPSPLGPASVPRGQATESYQRTPSLGAATDVLQRSPRFEMSCTFQDNPLACRLHVSPSSRRARAAGVGRIDAPGDHRAVSLHQPSAVAMPHLSDHLAAVPTR